MNKREADSLPYKTFSLRRGGYYPPALSIKFNPTKHFLYVGADIIRPPYKPFSLRRGGYYPPAVSIKFNPTKRFLCVGADIIRPP